MGIKGAQKLIKSIGGVKMHRNLRSYLASYGFRHISNKKRPVVAIDFSFYQRRFSRNPINLFLKQIAGIVREGAVPIYVFDGQYPKEKSYIVANRIKKKHQYIEFKQESSDCPRFRRVTSDVLKEMLRLLRIPWVVATGEADPLCAKLVVDKFATCCMTDDTDLVGYGADTIQYLPKGKICEYHVDHILSKIGVDHRHFIELAIALGCEHTRFLVKKNVNETYLFMAKHQFSLELAVTESPSVFTFTPAHGEIDRLVSHFDLPSEITVETIFTPSEEDFIDTDSAWNLLLPFLREDSWKIFSDTCRLIQRHMYLIVDTGSRLRKLDWIKPRPVLIDANNPLSSRSTMTY